MTFDCSIFTEIFYKIVNNLDLRFSDKLKFLKGPRGMFDLIFGIFGILVERI